MSIATLGLLLALASPTAPAPAGDPASPATPAPATLADLVAAERARAAAIVPVVPLPPPRAATTLQTYTYAQRQFLLHAQYNRGTLITPPPRGDRDLVLLSIADAERSIYLAEVARLDARQAADPHMPGRYHGSRAELLAKAAEAAAHFVLRLEQHLQNRSLHAHREELLYILAHELTGLGRLQDAAATARTLAAEYPASPLSASLDVLLAHTAMARGDQTAARALFHRALTSQAHHIHANAQISLGWSYLRGEHGEGPWPALALAAFTRALETVVVSENDDPTSLRRSAEDGLVHACAAAGRPAHAAALVRRLGKGRAVALLDQLAGVYFLRGQLADSAAIVRALVTDHPDDPRQCAWQLRLLLTAAAAGDTAAQAREALRLGEVWQAWSADPRLPQPDRARCHDAARAALTELSARWHTAADPKLRSHAAALAARIPGASP